MKVTVKYLSKIYTAIEEGGKVYIDREALSDASTETDRLTAELAKTRRYLNTSREEGGRALQELEDERSRTMTTMISRVEALLEGMAKSGIYVLDEDEAVAVLRRALDRADRHEAGVLETLTLQGIVLARRGS